MTNHKILVIGPLNQTALVESYARAFERLGMEVVRFDSERALMRASRFAGNRILRRALGYSRPDEPERSDKTVSRN